MPDFQSLPGWLLPLTVFCMGIFFATLCIRVIVEMKFPAITSWGGWAKCLRVLPVFLGGLCGSLMYRYPFLDALPTWGTRCFYGGVAGGLSGFGYMVLKAVVQKYFGVKVADGDSMSPPRGEDVPPVELSEARGPHCDHEEHNHAEERPHRP